MRALLQRVSQASVTVEGECIGKIDTGLLVLVCAMTGDSEAEATKLAAKIAKTRIFTDENGKMNRSVKDIGGDILAVSQFTLAADTRSGNRPGFSTAASPEDGRHLYDFFCETLRENGLKVETGRFAANMQVQLINDGPVTIWMDTELR